MNASDSAPRAHPGNWALSASALALVLVLVLVGGRGLSPAHAARLDVAQSGDYTALTCNGGNKDVLVILDGRSEQIFVYKVLNQNTVQLFQREDVARIFGDARARSRGSP